MAKIKLCVLCGKKFVDKKKKKFDCVEMQHRGGQRVMERLKGMTLEEEVAYWKKGTEELRKRQQQLVEKKHNR